jgi:hypothetical protein
MIEIKNRYSGSAIYTSECLTLREAVIEAAKNDADLRGAYLRGADLRGAYLSDADLRGADLSDADLSGADLRGANLSGAYLRGADLSGANLRGADLRGADLSGANLSDATIKTCAVFTGLYRYIAMPVIADDGTEHIRMGCYFRSVAEWESDFWNNPTEFTNDGSMKSKMRWMAYQTCLEWLRLHREVQS